MTISRGTMELKPVIVNYGVKVNPKDLARDIVAENDRLRSVAFDTLKRMNFTNIKGGAIIVSEVLHTGIPTDNHWQYMEKDLADSVASFYTPGFTPFLLNHNNGVNPTMLVTRDVLGTGTNMYAEYVSRMVEHPKGTATGYVKVATFIPPYSQHDGAPLIDLIGNRQIMHLSASATMKPEDNICSICNKEYFAEDHSHKAGRIYKGNMCIRQVYRPRFREYSAVPGNPGDLGATLREMSIIQDSLYGAADEGYDFIVSSDTQSSMVIYDTVKVFAPGGIGGGQTQPQHKEKKMDEAKILELLTENTKQVGVVVGVVKDAVTSMVAMTTGLAALLPQKAEPAAPAKSAEPAEPVKDSVTKEAFDTKIGEVETTIKDFGTSLTTISDIVKALSAKLEQQPAPPAAEPPAGGVQKPKSISDVIRK